MELRARVAATLASYLAGQRAALGEVAEELAPLLDELDALAAGGKRLRPAFCYWAWRGLGGADGDAIVAAAASLELLHACALVHDDVMDGSDTRRGRPSAHRAFAALHRAQGWRGDADRFGVGAAVLLGDLALAWSDELLMRCGLPDEAVDRARPVYDRVRAEVVAGQYLDVALQARGEASVAAALRVVSYKTVRYTVEGPLLLGAALMGAEAPVVQGFSRFGVPVGEAFQLRDDLLGVYGDPAVTGKPAGDDLREGKRSVLLAVGAGRGVDLGGIGCGTLGDGDVTRLREALVACGAVAEVEAMISTRREAGRRALDALPLTPQARTALWELVVASTDRVA